VLVHGNKFDMTCSRNRVRGRAFRWLVVVLICMINSAASVELAWAQGSSQDDENQQTMGLDKLYDAPEVFGYGVTVQLMDQPATSLLNGVVALRFNWVRQPVRWDTIEPVAGTYSWDKLDALVEAVAVRGLHLLLVVEGTPVWARPDGADLDLDGPPADLDTLSAFLSAVAERYAGQVDAYQIWQYPNRVQNWQVPGKVPDPKSYIRLLAEAYRAIKTKDPQARVVSAGLYPAGEAQSMMVVDDLAYLAAMYQEGAARCLDVLGVHLHGANFFSREYVEAILEIQSQYTEKPIWLTQVGWACAADGGVAQPCEAQQASYLIDAFTMAQEVPAIEALMVDNLNLSTVTPADPEAEFSLMRPDWSPRPAFVQLAQMRQYQVFTLERLGNPLGRNRAPQSGPKPHRLRPALAFGWGG